MSIKGFRVGNDTEKYDYPSLDNIPEGLVQDPNYQHIDVDAELDDTSENPVQNKVIAKSLSGDADSRLLEIALGAYPSDTASGAMVTFPDGANGIPVKSLTAQITPAQAGSGDPSPDNVRPISGWTGVTVERTGRNLLKLPPLDRPSRNGVEYEIVDGVLSFSGTSTSTSAPWVNSQHFSYELADNGPYPAGNFQISVDGFPTGVTSYTYLQLGIFHKDGTSDTSVYLIRGNGTGSAITQISLLDGDKLALFLQIARETTVDNTVRVLMTRTGESTDFEPYNGNTYSANWQDTAGTVYGGEMELVSGGLSRTYKAVDMGELEYYKLNDYYYAILPDAVVRPETAQTVPDALCSCYKVVAPNRVSSQTTYDDFACTISASFDRVLLRDSRYSTAADLKAALSGQKFRYRLAEPQTYQLPGTPIPTHKGVNNVWATTGDVAVNYRADTALYIEKKMGEQA